MKRAAVIGKDYSIGAIGGGYYGNDIKNDMPVRGPIEWLVNEAWKNGDSDMIYADILPEIEKDSGRQNLAKGFRAYADLYFCEPEKFGEAMDLIEKTMKRWGMQVALKPISTAYRARNLKFDLSPMINKLIDDPRGESYQLGYTVPGLLALGPKSERSVRMREVLEKLAEKWLGPKEGRQALIEKHYQASRGGSGMHNQKIQMMVLRL